jgi:hypothetical protein
VVPSGRIGALAQVLGAESDDDVLDALAGYYQQHGGRISQLLRGAEIAAEFDNWPGPIGDARGASRTPQPRSPR